MGFDDVFFRPFSASRFLEAVLVLRSMNLSGIRHVVGGELLSKYSFGCRVAEVFGLPAGSLHPGSIKYSSLDAVRSESLDLVPEHALSHCSPDLLDLTVALSDLRRTMNDRRTLNVSAGLENHGCA